MKEPVFPEEFVRKHCPKVIDAKNILKEPEELALMYAECEFQRAGCGMECHNCKRFLTRPFLHYKVDEKFLPLIEKYYEDSIKYEKFLEIEEENNRKIMQDCGSGI